MKRIHIFLVTLLTALAGSAVAPEVQLLTAAPGNNIYELEGHTALRIIHPRWGDFTVNWGVFDFDSPGFVYRFVKGETDYIAAAYPTERFVSSYARAGRALSYQTLALDSLQAERLTALVMENLRPENRVYRYNYVLDNCATRPLDMIASSIGSPIELSAPSLPEASRSTFRNVMRHYHRNYPWYQFGIDLALGSGIDRPLMADEPRFAPVVAREMVEEAKLPGGEQLVTRSGYLYGSDSTPSVVAPPTHWTLTPLFWGWAVCALSFCVSVLQMRSRPKWGRIFDTVWFSLTGLTGLLLTFLIFVSVHEATSPNWLYLWLNPLCFTGAVTPWLKRGKVLEISYQSVNFALLIVLGGIFLAGVQSPNPTFIPLMLATGLRAVTNIMNPLCAKKR